MSTTIYTGKEKRYNGKCKCGSRFSTLATRVQTAAHVLGPVADGASGFVEFHAEGRSFSESRLSNDSLWFRCACGRWNRAEPVRGTIVSSKKCNALCLASSGHSCECSCGGKNHGAQHG